MIVNYVAGNCAEPLLILYVSFYIEHDALITNCVCQSYLLELYNATKMCSVGLQAFFLDVIAFF